MSKEIIKAIDLLEKILEPLDACEPQCKLNLNPEKIRQAVTLLKQQPKDEAAKFFEQTKEKQPLREQPCGCILCICDTEDRCLGCGAKMCEKHKAIGHLPNEDMVYEQQPTAGIQTKWTVHIKYLELSQKQYHLEYDDRHVAFLTKEQYKSFEELLGKAPEQPAAGELTKQIRRGITLFKKRNEERRKQEPEMQMWPLDSFVHEDQVLEACDRLDVSEASRKDLLALCVEFMERADDGSADFDDPEPGSIFLRAEAVISKAKKEG